MGVIASGHDAALFFRHTGQSCGSPEVLMTARKSLAALAAALGLSFTLAGGVFADPLPETQAAFDRGVAAYRSGNAEGAVDEWKEAAEGGHTGAAWLLANLYDKGAGGVAQSDAKAYEYYLLAVRGGQPEAAVRLGVIYLSGNEAIGLKRNYEQALRSFEAASLAPRADAQYYLGIMHRRGWGTPVDRTESLRWLLLSAKKRYGPALTELGRVYMEGEGVERDRVEGWSYLLLGKRFGTPEQGAEADALMEKYDGWMKRGEKDSARDMADTWVSAHGGA
ncbi:Sel1 domain protein repeat-containing protein [Parvibaculum lavamentivorans DS-1]|uniref:Sel1 domain protein repeat-containing protein n=2 Tax=Parvibaculum lavamentivorans TaxID=256618 RepID=A7HXI5_PARL1|nr:Sel1 domain protein repeat-containing protein [Parvibaculum lavamentivorans DS-1]